MPFDRLIANMRASVGFMVYLLFVSSTTVPNRYGLHDAYPEKVGLTPATSLFPTAPIFVLP